MDEPPSSGVIGHEKDLSVVPRASDQIEQPPQALGPMHEPTETSSMTESTEKKYDWDLIEHLLQNIQKGANQRMTPNTDSQALVDAMAAKGRSARDVTQLDAQVRDYTALLLERGYLTSTGDAQSGGLMLTELGSRLLSAIDSSIPGDDRPRRTLDKQGDALDVEVFKEVTADPQLSNGAI
jgi:hypothetical protein